MVYLALHWVVCGTSGGSAPPGLKPLVLLTPQVTLTKIRPNLGWEARLVQDKSPAPC